MNNINKVAEALAEKILESLESLVTESPNECNECYEKAKFFESLEQLARDEGREEAAEYWRGVASAFRQIGLRLLT